MRPALLLSSTAALLLSAGVFSANAEMKVFQDAVFPYRVSCKTEWTQEIKNDTIFQLRNTLAGKKTLFQMKKYTDTGSTKEIMGWSRLNFAVNREMASKLGTVIASDTGINKKIGDLRAFELCALYVQVYVKDSVRNSKDTVWWGELSRWTEYLGRGYCVAVISDTADLIANRAVYRALLDSVSIGAGTSVTIAHRSSAVLPATSGVLRQAGALYTLMGRKLHWSAPVGAQLRVQRHRKLPVGFRPGGR